MAPKAPDVTALAEDVRKLLKRVDELELAKKNLEKKVADHATALTVQRNRCNDLNYKAESAEKRAVDLESKLKAVDHNSLARLSNSRLANGNTPLTPLKDFNTNLPIGKFPKHEKDVRFMSALEVTQTLTSLNASTSGNTGEQKTRVKEYIGLPPASAQKPSPTASSQPTPLDNADAAPTTAGAKPTSPAKNAAPQRPGLKKTMTMEDRKMAGIKAARAKAENDRQMGGRAPVKAKKPAIKEEGKGKGEDNGLEGATVVGEAEAEKKGGKKV